VLWSSASQPRPPGKRSCDPASGAVETQAIDSRRSSALHQFPGPSPRPTRGKGDETPTGQRNHSKTTVTSEKLIGLDESQLIRGWQFLELASTRSRRHWWRRRLAGAGESRPYGCPEWLAVRHDGTAGRACPPAPVDTFAHWAAPDRAHGKVRSVSFRTSFPTRRPRLRGSVAGAAVRRPRRCPHAAVGVRRCTNCRSQSASWCTPARCA